jgi:hypothetical protein
MKGGALRIFGRATLRHLEIKEKRADVRRVEWRLLRRARRSNSNSSAMSPLFVLDFRAPSL